MAIGSSNASTFTLGNTASTGGSSITITQITTSNTVFKITTNVALPLVLAAGKSSTITVAFDPTAAGAANGTLSIVVQGSASPTVASLSGTGFAAGQLSVSPSTINFGNASVGSQSSQTASLTASGSDVTVSSASWTGSGYSVSGIAFPVTVSAGKSVSFTMVFSPPGVGPSSGTISFASNAGNSPTVATLSGTGIQHSVSLSWNPSTSTVAGYNVYRGAQSGGPYTPINTLLEPGTSYTDTNVQPGATYFYVVTAVDGSGQESNFSNEAKAIVPTP